MTRRWLESRRRWFLLTFTASTWIFFVNDLAALGEELSGGGIGSQAVHAASVVGTVALAALFASIFQLRLTDFAVALGLGLGLNFTLGQAGVGKLAASGFWSLECEAGDGTACHNLANYYDSGGAVFAGSLDSARLHRRACQLGGPATALSCRRLGATTAATTAGCEPGAYAACLAEASRREAAGELRRSYDAYLRACKATQASTSPQACMRLIDSGHQDLRKAACKEVKRLCRNDESSRCGIVETRCGLANSEVAGTL